MSRRLRAGQLFALSMGTLLVIVATGLVVGLLALDSQGEKRRQLADRIDPARIAAESFLTAMVDEETGVRGFALSGSEVYLAPYERGTRDASRHLRALRRSRLEPEAVDAVAVAAERWRREYAEPTIAARKTEGGGFDATMARGGRERFEAIRAAVADLEGRLDATRASTRAELADASERVRIILIVLALATLLAVLATAYLLGRTIVRPLGRLADTVGDVAHGNYDARVEVGGAREVAEVGAGVEAMRGRIVAELDSLNAARDELQRSNAELEQFAYVASHDLQEPLRKVASFTQMLQRRYEGQLDERADQYIGFAVDGAKRMQDLINDLLAFSRVGRVMEDLTEVDLDEVVAHALADLDMADATIEVGELPTVRGEERLLEVVFANLISNGLKFRGDEPPVIRVGATLRDGEWCFTVADNGIGVEPEYADRIFVIFQRLHPRSAYSGTGIGLSLCRKIIEYHGGRIWLAQDADRGATFHFTLPAGA